MKRVAAILCQALLICSANTAARDYGVSKGNEELLLKGLNSLAAQQFDTALNQFRELTEKRPDFRLAQLVYADLLASQGNPLGQVGSEQQQRRKEIQGMIDEARARLLTESKPWGSLIPSSLIKMSDKQKYVIVVNTKYSRLFLYENRNGVPHLIKDFYASYGRGGTDKFKQGDLKTPLGVYFVTGRLLSKNLPERYGSGALPINYPNAWDYRLGKTGNGIWVHGSPVDTYSRPPKASEGCISLTNPDFIELDEIVDIAHTPVLIGHDMEWIDQQAWLTQKKELEGALEMWRADWESQDHERLMSHYSKTFSDGKMSYNAFSKHKQRVNSAKDYIKIELSDLSVYRYPNNPNLLVVTFDQDYRSNNFNGVSRKRQYWVKEDSVWRIAFEGAPSKGKP